MIKKINLNQEEMVQKYKQVEKLAKKYKIFEPLIIFKIFNNKMYDN